MHLHLHPAARRPRQATPNFFLGREACNYLLDELQKADAYDAAQVGRGKREAPASRHSLRSRLHYSLRSRLHYSLRSRVRYSLRSRVRYSLRSRVRASRQDAALGAGSEGRESEGEGGGADSYPDYHSAPQLVGWRRYFKHQKFAASEFYWGTVLLNR